MRAALLITAGVWACGTATAAGSPALEGDGFSVPDGARAWSRWQTRVAVGSASASPLRYTAATPGGAGLKWRGFNVLGDYYFSPSLAVRPGGFRATSGLLVGMRSSLSPADSAGGRGAVSFDRSGGGLQAVGWPAASADAVMDLSAVPYVGIGYTGASLKGGLSFSADLGLMAIGSASAVKLGRALGGAQSLDDTLREMRLSPVLQLGVSYSF